MGSPAPGMPAVSLLMKAVTWLSGTAPMKPSAGWPLTKAITAGIDWMPIWPGIAGCSSMFILTSLTLPLAARTAFSMIGVSWRQGPHHGAQKSISTGWRFDSSMTSFTNVWVVVSLIRSGAACGAGPLPCSTIVTGSSPDVRLVSWSRSSDWDCSSTAYALIGGWRPEFAIGGNPQSAALSGRFSLGSPLLGRYSADSPPCAGCCIRGPHLA